MSAREIAGTWGETYRRIELRASPAGAIASITTAISDHLTVVSNLNITMYLECGSSAAATIRLSSQQMRDLSSYLLIASDRIYELEQMREGMIAGLEVAA